ncbi:MAG TPA: Qat anti-phage system TatD family nuclease QatD [Rhodanobacter sp.]
MIDFHAHLDLYPDPHAVVGTCIELGAHVLSVTTTPSAFECTAALAADAPRIRTALGLHPQIAGERHGELPLFAALLPEVRYVGEIGLDGGQEFSGSWSKQVDVFNAILGLCADAGGRVFSVHSRRAVAEVLDAIERNPGAGTPVLHWFAGTGKELRRAASLGCWFSVGPAMLAGAKGRALASSMPRERVLTESDGPFAQTSGRTLMPWDAALAEDVLAALWDADTELVASGIHDNLRTLGIDAARMR